MLTSTALLVHYDPTKPLVISCDASHYGVGALLSQVCSGEEKPVAYASMTLTKAERNYSQPEKGLALLFGVKKFHVYLFVSMFTCLAGTLLFALTTSLCRAYSMNPSLFLAWHLRVYGDEHSHLLHMNTQSSTAWYQHCCWPSQQQC